jgi:hypothetical protein
MALEAGGPQLGGGGGKGGHPAEERGGEGGHPAEVPRSPRGIECAWCPQSRRQPRSGT